MTWGTKRKEDLSWTERALGKLTRRDFSQAEMRKFLEEEGAPESEIAGVIDSLCAMGYLNDERLKEAMARSSASARRGPGHLWGRLMKRGFELSRADVSRLYREAAPESEEDLARSEAERAWGKVSKRESDVRKTRQKVAARLIRRGFSPSVAFKICEGMK